jgi:prepilin-type processing-associated H-X9-DG protein
MIALGDCPAVLPVPRDLTITITPADLLWVLSPHIFPVYSAPGVGNWHNGGANLVFCDAHVEYAKQSIWMATNAAIRKLWNTNYRP